MGDLKRFVFTDEHQFVLKYLDALDNKLLTMTGPGTKQWDYAQHKNIEFDRAIDLVLKYSANDLLDESNKKKKKDKKIKPKKAPKSTITIVYLQSFLNFLYRQFIQLSGAMVLIGQDVAVDVAGSFRKKKYIQYHSVIALSFARMAKYFACDQYAISNPLLATNLLISSKAIIEQSISSETDEEPIKTYDFEQKENELLYRQNSESAQVDETRGDETFSLVKEWSKADPPIVFLNASHIVSITKPHLKQDLNFMAEKGENSYTLLCSDLDQCNHPDAEEWKAVQKIMLDINANHLGWDLYNFKKEDEIRRQNVEKGKLRADSEK